MLSNLTTYLQGKKNLVFALLFGSYAKQTQTFLSDVDIAIYTTKPLPLIDLGLLLSDLEEITHKKVDVVILNDLYKTDARLAFNIVNNHKVLYQNNTEVYTEFKSQSMQYYFDIMPMYELFETALNKRLNDGTFAKV